MDSAVGRAFVEFVAVELAWEWRELVGLFAAVAFVVAEPTTGAGNAEVSQH